LSKRKGKGPAPEFLGPGRRYRVRVQLSKIWTLHSRGSAPGSLGCAPSSQFDQVFPSESSTGRRLEVTGGRLAGEVCSTRSAGRPLEEGFLRRVFAHRCQLVPQASERFCWASMKVLSRKGSPCPGARKSRGAREASLTTTAQICILTYNGRRQTCRQLLVGTAANSYNRPRPTRKKAQAANPSTNATRPQAHLSFSRYHM
jgi:hypothetical protein